MWNTEGIKAIIEAAALATICLSGAVLAQDKFPSKPIRIVVTTGVGGAVELHTRIVSTPLSEILGQPIIIDNKNGFNVGAPLVTKAKPDGYSWYAASVDVTTTPWLDKDSPIDPLRDFAPIGTISQSGFFLLVNPKLPVSNVRELIALAKTQPGKLSVSGGLPGSGSHMVGVWFSSEAGINTVQVPYKGASAALTELIAGRVEISFAGSNALTLIRSGKVKVLGISLARRSSLTPDIPTIAEQGLPDYQASNFRGLVTTAGTPDQIINRIAVEIDKISKRPETVKAITADGSDPMTINPDEFRRFLIEDTARWGRVIKANNIKLE